MKKECLFCKIATGDFSAERVYEDDFFLGFLDINPINPGHTLLIPKEHYQNILEIPDETLSKIGPVIKKISGAVKDATGADGINIGMNNEQAAGQVVFHAHIHIMPRHLSDNYELWHGKPYDNKEVMEELGLKIKNHLK